MLSATEFRKVVSGERHDLAAQFLRAALGMASIPYGIVAKWRNRQFDRGTREIVRMDVPVISVGNLTVGGTGKTPMVEWLARWFRQHDKRVCLISRGYGAEAGAKNDEALELEQKLPDVPHLQNPDRVAAARTAIEEFESEVIILDDGFQHRRIHRDLDIVLIDALQPFGYGHLLPRGLLREPISSLSRADIVALSRSDAIEHAERDRLHQEVTRRGSRADWIEVSHRPNQLTSSSGQTAPIDGLLGRQVAAFCGIGNPAGFRHSLEACGFNVVAFREFPDHHSYTPSEIATLADLSADAEAIVCTHKDLVKIQLPDLDGLPLWALQIGLSVDNGQKELVASLEALLAAM